MDVAAVGGRLNLQSELLIEKLDKAMQAMVGAPVAVIDQRIAAIKNACLRVGVSERGDMGIVQPEVRGRRADIGLESSRIMMM